MFKRALFLHWKAGGLALLPFSIASFGLPLLSIQGLSQSTGSFYLSAQNPWLPLFPALAAGLGFTVALTGWSWDHHGGHTYALSLPVPRWSYSLTKMGAGAAMLLLPTLFFLVGASIAAFSVDVPAGLNTYPLTLTLRFFFASIFAFAGAFALASGSMRSVTIFISVVIGVLLLGEIAFSFLDSIFPQLSEVSFIEFIYRVILRHPGPLRIYTGAWTLVDV